MWDSALVDSEVVGEALRERVNSPLAADDLADNLAIDRPPGSSVRRPFKEKTSCVQCSS